ncbi:phospholipase D-like domain-containing protein [Meiothermus sp.]|uniref:phospholipase D-like domain-containing protein n=1 Tax=Meiothermus sp. TaxID=1955249 RepID=UPI0021DC7495|nr:phospholipase D-like domain-containing protein [Meiothermus sp.]GIW32809.1 MAG: hypothetical protein KatS3mg072_0142 [Meiothermus sp.]
MNAKLIVSPESTEGWIREGVLAAKESILIAAPYVGRVLWDLLLTRPRSLPTTLITSLRIGDVLGGASDIQAIYELSQNHVRVQSISNLHAKLYIVDQAKVLITSANPTQNGWRNNLEMGLALHSSEIARRALQILQAAKPYRWTSSQLKRYADWAAVQPKVVSKPWIVPVELLYKDFGGWLGLVMRAVAQLPEEFTLTEVYQLALPQAAQEYPNNHHPRDKIRQQLQGLRDLGLLEFVTPGRYRRLKVDLMDFLR